MSNARNIQQWWGVVDVALDCRRYGTPSLRGIPLASQYWSTSLSWGKLRTPQRPTLGLILTIDKTVIVARDPGRVTAILYIRLAMSFSSLVMILLYIYTYYHSQPCLQPYSYNYHTYAYEAERWRTCPYSIIHFSVNGYVSLMGFRDLPLFPTRDITKSKIENTALQMRYQSITTAKHRALIVPSSNCNTWWLQRRVHRPIGARGVSLAITTSMTSTRQNFPTLPTREIEYDRSNSVGISFLHVHWAQSPAQAPTMDGVTVPLNTAISTIKGEVGDDFHVSTVTTIILLFEWSAPISVSVYTYSSSNLEEAHFQRHSTAAYTYGYTTRAKKHTYGRGSVYKWSTLTAMNVCTSEVHLQRRHPMIEAHREVHFQAGPTQLCRRTMMTTMTTKSTKTTQCTIIMGNQSTYNINNFRL